jgi:hypothetical protein
VPSDHADRRRPHQHQIQHQHDQTAILTASPQDNTSG